MKMNCHKAKKQISLALDNRLGQPALASLQGHLDRCPLCREWQKQQSVFMNLFSTRQDIEMSPDFFQKLQSKMAASPAPSRFLLFQPDAWRPLVLRAAMLMIMILAAFIGFSLGGRLDASGAGGNGKVFNQALNLDAFADLPAESFGAVYDHLLQVDRP